MSTKLRKATELAHLIETHPDLEYRGHLYADSLGMNYSRGHPNYLEEKENIEDSLNNTADELESHRFSTAKEDDLDKDIDEMLSQVRNMNQVTYLDKKRENTRIWRDKTLEELQQRTQKKIAEIRDHTYFFGR